MALRKKKTNSIAPLKANKKAAKNREICLMHLLPANTTPKTRSMPEEVIYEDVT